MDDDLFLAELKRRIAARRNALAEKLAFPFPPDDPEEFAAYLRGDDVTVDHIL